MAGHNKWSKIKRKKGANDAKRGKLFTRLIREITVAAREGGGNPEGNPRLSQAITAAKAGSMPSDNIERAIKKGTGEIEGAQYEEYGYEAYGPGGVAIMIDAVTDNKQRTTAEIRHMFSKSNGSLAEPNAVAWNFDRRGLILAKAESMNEEKMIEIAIESGADDVVFANQTFEIYTHLESLFEVKRMLESHAELQIESAALVQVPKNTVEVSEQDAQTLLKLLDQLEEHDDIQNVYENSEISEEIMEKLDV